MATALLLVLGAVLVAAAGEIASEAEVPRDWVWICVEGGGKGKGKGKGRGRGGEARTALPRPNYDGRSMTIFIQKVFILRLR